MLKIIYCKTGENVDDVDVNWYVDQKLEDYYFGHAENMEISVSNINVINRFAEQVGTFIPETIIQFYWENMPLDLDADSSAKESTITASLPNWKKRLSSNKIQKAIDLERDERKALAIKQWSEIHQNAKSMNVKEFQSWCTSKRGLTQISIGDSEVYIWFKNKLQKFKF